VDENSRAMAASLIGALVGALVGYLFFTEQGRRWRRQVEPALEDLSRELNSFRGTVAKAAGVANDTWKLLNEVAGDDEFDGHHHMGPGQSSPF
jgi:uncharacterized membrane-anchored protein YhcB (DUF1043 family)